MLLDLKSEDGLQLVRKTELIAITIKGIEGTLKKRRKGMERIEGIIEI